MRVTMERSHLLLSFCYVLVLLAIIPPGLSQGEWEVCQLEVFNSSCEVGSVMWVERAMYGRMSLGRCVSRDYGYLGCQNDVLSLVSEDCTASVSCSFTVASLQPLVQPCPQDLMSYLFLRHSCLKVENSVMCTEPQPVRVTSTSGYIASVYTTLGGAATADCPIYVPLAPHQTVNLTVRTYYTTQHDLQEDCPHTLLVQTQYVQTQVQLCNRHQQHYSFQEEVYIYFTGIPGDIVRHFVEFQVLGCPLLQPPGTATFELLSTDRGAVKCGSTVWYVTCVGNVWSGKVGNCSRNDDDTMNTLINGRGSDKVNGDGNEVFPFGWLLLIFAGFLLGVIVLSSPVVVMLILHKKRKRASRGRTEKGHHLLVRASCPDDTHTNNCEDCQSIGSLGHNYYMERPHYTSNIELQRTGLTKCQPAYSEDPRLHKTQTLPHGIKMSPKPAKQPTKFTTFKPDDQTCEPVYNTYQSRRGLVEIPKNNTLRSTCGDYSTQEACKHHTRLRPDLIQGTTEETTAVDDSNLHARDRIAISNLKSS